MPDQARMHWHKIDVLPLGESNVFWVSDTAEMY